MFTLPQAAGRVLDSIASYSALKRLAGLATTVQRGYDVPQFVGPALACGDVVLLERFRPAHATVNTAVCEKLDQALCRKRLVQDLDVNAAPTTVTNNITTLIVTKDDRSISTGRRWHVGAVFHGIAEQIVLSADAGKCGEEQI